MNQIVDAMPVNAEWHQCWTQCR